MGSDVVKRMVDAADAFLQALSTEQRSKAQLDFFDEAERKRRHYVPRERQGLSIRDMDERQRLLAHKLVASGVSGHGYDKIQTIISLEEVLAEIEGTGRRFPRDPQLYYVSIFGSPGSDAPWGWRFEGHHVSLNYTLIDGVLVGPPPLFWL